MYENDIRIHTVITSNGAGYVTYLEQFVKQKENETIEHLLWECNIVKGFYIKLLTGYVTII